MTPLPRIVARLDRMDLTDPRRYGESFADVYDDWYSSILPIDGAVDFLCAHARGRPTLELGVGTGRLAVPLAASGMNAIGIDASRAMLDRLRAVDTDGRIPLLIGDMAAPGLRDATFGLVFVAYNTLFNLSSASAQEQCLWEVHRLLRPGGELVVEAWVPRPDSMPVSGSSQRALPGDGGVTATTFHDRTTQVISGEHLEVGPDGERRRPWLIRYLSPDQIDELAHGAGLTIVERWADWHESPFDAASDNHVSVYRRADRKGST